MASIADRTVLVTGASRGIGRALVTEESVTCGGRPAPVRDNKDNSAERTAVSP